MHSLGELSSKRERDCLILTSRLAIILSAVYTLYYKFPILYPHTHTTRKKKYRDEYWEKATLYIFDGCQYIESISYPQRRLRGWTSSSILFFYIDSWTTSYINILFFIFFLSLLVLKINFLCILIINCLKQFLVLFTPHLLRKYNVRLGSILKESQFFFYSYVWLLYFINHQR